MPKSKNSVNTEHRLTKLETCQQALVKEVKLIRTNHLVHIQDEIKDLNDKFTEKIEVLTVDINDRFMNEAKWRIGLLTAVILTLLGTILNLLV